MPTLPITVSATRAELSLPDLQLNDGVAYTIVEMGPGTRVRRNTYNRSGNANGGTLNNSVLDLIVRPLVVRVFGSTQTELNTRTAALMACVEQSEWTLTEQVNSVATVYSCMCAESISPADPSGASREDIDKFQLLATPPRHVYRIAVPTQPQPTNGPI